LYDWVNYIFADHEIKFPKPMEHDKGEVFLIPELDQPEVGLAFLKDHFVPLFLGLLHWQVLPSCYQSDEGGVEIF